MVNVGNIKEQLRQKLLANNLLWSYGNAKNVVLTDDLLIETVLVYLDLEETNQLFAIYPYEVVKHVWTERLVRQNNKYRRLNSLLALLYFGATPGKQQVMVNNIYNQLQW